MSSVRLTELLARLPEGSVQWYCSPLEGEQMKQGWKTSEAESWGVERYIPPPGQANAFPDSPSRGEFLTDPLMIQAITQDSRQVRPGTLFAAIPGTAHNGEAYIAAAIAAGAVAILCRPEAVAHTQDAAVAVLVSEEPRKALSLLAAAFYQPQPASIVAITGTDGKTSTAEFTRQFWELLGIAALSIGTLGLKTDQLLHGMPPLSDNTTPEPVAFYHALSAACRQGIHHVVCEASSHGLEQYRLEGVHPNVAVFTSFSQDHLDYHHTMDAYFAAKAALFERLLPQDGYAVLCSDYPAIAELAASLRAKAKRVITYGKSGDVAIRAITPIPSGQSILLAYDGQDYTLQLPIFGAFQVYNVVAAALAASLTVRMHLAELLPLLPRLTTIRGRLELVGKTAGGALIFVDYAHTAGALEKALETLRPYASQQLHLVFGCGGDRDRGKRLLMGAVAARLADRVIVTDDNPRHEDAASIRRAVLDTCKGALDIADRREAIATAIRALNSGDVLLIAGKGHEDYQIIGAQKHPFDDAAVVADALGEMMLHA
jgi:UDP-N-acetylmuramoyl-L-alanyl-D-glutamate--2,6-diaminopimelate ligase